MRLLTLLLSRPPPRPSALYVSGRSAEKVVSVLRPCLDDQLDRDNLDAVRESVRRRRAEVDVEELSRGMAELKQLAVEKAELLQRRAETAARGAELRRSPRGVSSTAVEGSPCEQRDSSALAALRRQGTEIKQRLRALQEPLWRLEEAVLPALARLPGPLDPSTPDRDLLEDVSVPAEDASPSIPLPTASPLFPDVLPSAVSPGAYYLHGAAADLELALQEYVCRGLTSAAYSRVSCPDTVKSLVAEGCGAKFVLGILKRLVSLHGADKVRALVPAQQDWKVYFGTDDHVVPLVNAQLGFLVSGANVPLSVEEAPPAKGVRSLLARIQQEGDNVQAWLERQLTAEERASKEFVKDFVCALCFDAIVIDNGAKKVQLSRLEKHSSLLKCLIVNMDLELAALYGLLALVRHLQFPPGVLDQCFRQLYDSDVVSEPAFARWREDKDPAEQEGHGVALMSVQAFFKAMEEDSAAGEEDERT